MKTREDFMQTNKGVSKEIISEFKNKVISHICDYCQGTGIDDNEEDYCPNCKGSGDIEIKY